MMENNDYKPDPQRQSLTPSVAEFFSVLGEMSLSISWRAIKALLIGAGVLLLGIGAFIFISSAVSVGVASAK